MRFLVRTVIETANNGLSVSGEAADGASAIEQWRADRPEVIVLDQRMPGLTGLEVAERILAEYPEQRIILFSAYLEPDTVAEATRVGIHLCLPKSEYSRLPEVLWGLASPA